MKFQLEEDKKRKKKKGDGWSWFERVHKEIPQGDPTVPISVFNNSVDFNAMTPDGGNMVMADSGAGMSMGEAFEELNDDTLDIDKLLVIYYKDVLDKYKDTRDVLRANQKKYHSLKNSNSTPDNSLIGAIKRQKEQLRELERKINRNLNVNNLLSTLEIMTQSELSQVLSQEDKEYVVDYINRLERDRKKPMIGQRFKYSTFIPSTYIVEKVDDDFVYYSVEGRDYEKTYPLDSFIKDKEDGTIRYVD